MHTADALATLHRHQGAILDQIDGAVTLARRSPEEALPALSAARWQAVRKLRAYQIFKHVEIFIPAEASGSMVQRVAAAQMKARCIAMSERLEAYVKRWSSTDVTTRWPEYTADLAKLVAALRTHLADEERAITSLLSGAARTRRLQVRPGLRRR